MRLMAEIIIPVLLVGCLMVAIVVTGEQECDGFYKGRMLTLAELAIVLGNHQTWLESGRYRDDVRRANLCQANLQLENLVGANLQGATLGGANLQGATLGGANLQDATLGGANLVWANLRGANLQGANLWEANLQDANLGGANLAGANLVWANLWMAFLAQANLQKAEIWGANLQRASLVWANLQGAILWGANLQHARLAGATLQGAGLSGANLQGAILWGANLQGANLWGANLQQAVWEPDPGKLPDLSSLVDPNNHLEKLLFHNSPAALMALREAFKKGGMRTQERQLTYAIEHTKRLQAWDPWWHNPREVDTRPWLEKLAGKSESLFRYVLFELSSGYGMVPSRTLAILGLLFLVCSLVYMIALLTARGQTGIWVTWPPDRVYQEEHAKEATRITSTFFFPRLQARAEGHWWGVLLRSVSVPLIGLYFSLLSAFSLGWRELNIGIWIARIQPREYTLRSTGWVRTVSGIQSLLSVYLLALWVLTYFGRPFE